MKIEESTKMAELKLKSEEDIFKALQKGEIEKNTFLILRSLLRIENNIGILIENDPGYRKEKAILEIQKEANDRRLKRNLVK